MMINISWRQFELNQSAKDISFESFCYQVAYILYSEYGYFDNFYNTPGSEFYLKLNKDCGPLNLKKGDEIGWQVKWWFNSEDNTSLVQERRTELEKGFKTTLRRHPDIKLWIICTPGSFQEDAYKKLLAKLASLSSGTVIMHWNKAKFENFRADDFEKFGHLFHNYFNLLFVGFNFLKEYTERRLEDLKNKYDTELYTPSQYDNEILLTIDYKRIFDELYLRSKYLKDEVEKIENDNYYFKKDFNSFTQNYVKKAYQLLYLTVDTSKKVIEAIDSGLTIIKGKLIYEILKKHSIEHTELADLLNQMIHSKEHRLNKNDQRENWWHEHYVIGSVNRLQTILGLGKDETIKDNTILELINELFKKDIHILSSAGYGKTNLACNISQTCIKNGIPCVLILGSAFRKTEKPQKIILEELNLDSKYTFKDFLQAINTLGFIKGVKIPIIIDGLNESRPYDLIWRSNIKDIIRDFENVEYVILITTCRDGYIQSIFETNDFSKISNTKLLIGLGEKQRIEAIPKYFKKYNIEPLDWNFNRELFKNPLLLKIFSEVNKNRKNIHISLENIFTSIDKYIIQIEENVSVINSTVDDILKNKVRSSIVEYCNCLWERNSREIPLTEFNNILAPESPALMGSLTRSLLDEGLCFQTNLGSIGETVQFTYDLVAGYAIASKILINNTQNTDNLSDSLKNLGIEKKLFTKDTAHPLRQDILMSLLYLLPLKFNVHLFEVFDVETVIEECLNNVDYFINDIQGQEKLLQCFSGWDKTSHNFKLLFEKLFENTYLKGVYGLGELTIKVLNKLNQSEIDLFWSELIRKNRVDVYQLLSKINKLYCQGDNDRLAKEYLQTCFLATTSSDKTIRSLATENLFLISKKHPNEILELGKLALYFSDQNSLESLIIAVCGSVLSLQDKVHTQNCLEFLEGTFLPSFESTHICIIDYILTIAEFGKKRFGFDHLDKNAFNKKHFHAIKDTSVEKKLISEQAIYFPRLFGLDLYDFNKYQIGAIESDTFKHRKTYSSIECLAYISTLVKQKGFEETSFETISKEIIEDRRHQYGQDVNNNLTTYQEKYLWQSYYEFVGFLVLGKKLKPENKIRYRSDYNFFDPTFPRMPEKFQIVKECFFPSNDENVQEWINSDKSDYLDEFLTHHLYTGDEWVLLSLSITQAGEKNDTRVNLYIDSYLIPPNKIRAFKIKIDNGNFHISLPSFYNLYAGEINWSQFADTLEGEALDESLGILELMNEYTWSGWTGNRYETPYFKFINSRLSNLTNLVFNVDDLSYYDGKEQVTKIVWTENSKLYYVKRKIIEELKSKMDLEFVWNQFISKYGEFGKHQDNKLNPSYKDLRRLIRFSDVFK